ncbi:MAG: amidohydrolase [Chitinophagaceae bacterium]|nr:amidohydrolase [Chitinophagaceae bacterium]
MNELKFTLIQANLIWENVDENLANFEKKINAISNPTHVVVLPEMFNTGFSMNATQLAENMDGKTMMWMKKMAKEKKIILCGSLMIKESDFFYNRMIWMQPDGKYFFYDKRHLFSLAGEEKVFTKGENRVIVQVGGWRILLQVCYDLRFPVWSRQQNNNEYDVVLYVANWPDKRILAWNTLLQARAIENLSYSIGVNRVGHDEKGNNYIGNSKVFSPLGEQLIKNSESDEVLQVVLEKDKLNEIRSQFNFLSDKDDFLIQ